MKKTIQTRRKVKPMSPFKKLHAKTTTRKRRMRANTAMADPYIDIESEVPNVGIGRALIVILVLHVVAVGAIIAHSKFFSESSDDAVATSDNTEQANQGSKSVVNANLPLSLAESQLNNNDRVHIVKIGENYRSIAVLCNVDESALRELNGNRDLRAGDRLNLPYELSSHSVPVQESPKENTRVASAPRRVVEPRQPRTNRAIIVEEGPEPAVTVRSHSAPKKSSSARLIDSGKRYKVKSGDTVWRIAHNHGVTIKALLTINGIKDPSKLRIGKTLIIPVK